MFERDFVEKMHKIILRTKNVPDIPSMLFTAVDFLLNTCDRCFKCDKDDDWPFPRNYDFARRKYRCAGRTFDCVILKDSFSYYILFEFDEESYRLIACASYSVPFFDNVAMDIIKIRKIERAIHKHVLTKMLGEESFPIRPLNERKLICVGMDIKQDLNSIDENYSLQGPALKCYNYVPASMKNYEHLHEASMLANTLCFLFQGKVGFDQPTMKWDNGKYEGEMIWFISDGNYFSFSLLEDCSCFYVIFRNDKNEFLREFKISKKLIPTFKNQKAENFFDTLKFQIIIPFCIWSLNAVKKTLTSAGKSRSSNESERSDESSVGIPVVEGFDSCEMVRMWVNSENPPIETEDDGPSDVASP